MYKTNKYTDWFNHWAENIEQMKEATFQSEVFVHINFTTFVALLKL